MEDRGEAFKNVFTELIFAKLELYRSIAVKIVNSADDADDAVQSALLKAWNKQSSFKSDFAALSGWISRIIVTESYDILRRRIRKKCKEADLPEAETQNDLMLEKLDRAIGELPELYRETVHIAILSGLTGEEAARQLGCSPNTLYQRIHKAKALIREIMEKMQNE